MRSTARVPMLGDAPGPRARRRARIASALALALIAGGMYLAYRRLSNAGELVAAKWDVFTRPEVQRFFAVGLVNTLRAAGLALLLAGAFGILLALGRLSRSAPVRLLAGGYIQLFRALPLLILVLFVFFGLPKLGLELPRYQSLVLALTLYNAAVLGEIIRSGILSLDRGQGEAASALGLRHWQAMGNVILPQAFRRMIPTVVSQAITLLKDTTLGVVISYEELLRRGQEVGQFAKNDLQAYTVVALVYLVVCLSLSRVARHLEVRQRRRYQAAPINVTGAEDLLAVNLGAGHAGAPA